MGLFGPKKNYSCKISYEDDYHNTRYTSVKVFVDVITELHSSAACEIIHNMALSASRGYISGENDVKKTVAVDKRYRDICFSSSFASQMKELNSSRILMNEVKYIKEQPQYLRFTSSSFFRDLVQELRLFLEHGKHRDYPLELSYVTHFISDCRLSGACWHNSEEDNEGFTFRLYEKGVRGEYYPFLSTGNYRKLTSLETSMLSVALMETFPKYFSVEWNLNIFQKAWENWMFDFHLTPKFITVDEPTKIHTLKDIW